jgi:hypothetical protein
MKATKTVTEEQQRRVAIQHGLAQVRLEDMEPSPLFFELAELYIQGQISLEEAIELAKQAASSHS